VAANSPQEGWAPDAPPAAASPTQVAGEAAAGPSAVELFIPYKNGAALAAYYLGVFSLLCGLLLGIPALVLGIMGLRFSRLHPEIRGKVHAWIGIVLGSLTTAISLTVIGLAVREFLAGRR
jgi:hypothetical protein